MGKILLGCTTALASLAVFASSALALNGDVYQSLGTPAGVPAPIAGGGLIVLVAAGIVGGIAIARRKR